MILLSSDVYWDLIQKCIAFDGNNKPLFNQIYDILKDDKFTLEEFGMKTNLDQFHEYQKRIDYL